MPEHRLQAPVPSGVDDRARDDEKGRQAEIGERSRGHDRVERDPRDRRCREPEEGEEHQPLVDRRLLPVDEGERHDAGEEEHVPKGHREKDQRRRPRRRVAQPRPGDRGQVPTGSSIHRWKQGRQR